MITATKIEIEYNKKTSEHTFYSQPESKGLVVIFPGGGNSCDRPILHYSRKYLLYNGCDVLCISYTNIIDEEGSNEQKIENIVIEVSKAIKEVEKGKSYTNKIFISSSFGNIVSNELKIRKSFKNDKSIYLSPTAQAVKYFEMFPGFIITGTNDEYLPQEEIDKLVKKYKDTILVFENGTHSLENANVQDSLDFCKTAVTTILDYLDVV